ncbi:ATP-binding protein [Silvanigrella aquatica]|uniref:histidine kinase n=1 Tax=Silvanigrella aquatica TaxID=1915309 RepID=A0A1L4D485_9BACT|nr:ATP-binding protein [Silvanigrella aquatica]APJ04982.1 hypothetical protein AXG55_14200 [Silvanigrella aquatica]
MRAIYNLKTIKFESCAPIIKKIIGTYLCFLFILFVISSIIFLNNFKQFFSENHVFNITTFITITFFIISCTLVLLLWIILKNIISPLVKLITHSKNSTTLQEKEIPENISSEIIELYKITNESIARINEYQEKKIENEKNKAIAMTTQMLAHDIRKPFQILKISLEIILKQKDSDNLKKIALEVLPEIDRTIKKVEGMISDVLEIGKTSENISLTPTDPELFIENTQKIFNKFYTQKKNGTGLGLAIVEKVIKEHGGNIYCTSEMNSEFPEGKVEFWFTLPIAEGYLKYQTINNYDRNNELNI